MIELLIWIGRIAGLAGFGLTALAFGARALGIWRVAEMGTSTLLQGAIAASALGALAYAAAIAERGRRD
jgi:hypothetical protein